MTLLLIPTTICSTMIIFKTWYGRGAFSLFFLLSLFYLPSAVLAHSIQTDGSVLMMLHASPDDSPIIGQPAILTFYITDKEKRFTAAECDCRLEISFADQVIFSTTTFAVVKNNVLFSYTFPHKGTYGVNFIATPKIPGLFQGFKFSDDDAVVVSRTMEEVKALQTLRLRICLVAGLVVLLLAALFSHRFYHKPQQQNSEDKNNTV